MKRHPSRPPLEGVDEENGGPTIHVPHAQAERFSKTNPSAIEDQNQRPVKSGSKERALKISAQRQESSNVLFGKKIGDERGLGWQAGPDWFGDDARIGSTAEVTVELSENRRVAGNADWFYGPACLTTRRSPPD